MERRKSVRIADDESVNGVFGGENIKSEKARGKERAVEDEEPSGWVSRIGVQDDSDDVSASSAVVTWKLTSCDRTVFKK